MIIPEAAESKGELFCAPLGTVSVVGTTLEPVHDAEGEKLWDVVPITLEPDETEAA